MLVPVAQANAAPQHPKWYAEMALLCVVLGITVRLTKFLVRPAAGNILGLRGTMRDGEWRIVAFFKVVLRSLPAVY